MTTCEPSENLQYFIGIPKTKKQEEDEPVQREQKNIWTPLISIFISSSFLVCFEQFKKLRKHHLKLLKTFLKCKDNRMMSKNLKL